MKQTMDCTMGRIEKSKFLIKPSCKNQKFTCAHIFWDFMLNQVRQGLMTYESLMASVKGLSPSNEACGTGGGSGGKAVYGYTGTSPPETNKQLWYKSFLSIAATFLLGFMLLFVACEDTKIENDRVAKMDIKGEKVKEFDTQSGINNVLNPEVLKLLLLADGRFHWTPKEYSAAEMAWLRAQVEELIAAGNGKKIDGDGTFINPRAISPEDSTFFADLNFTVSPYRDGDECDEIKKEYARLKTEFINMKKLCLDTLLIRCFEIDLAGWPYKDAYDYCLPRDDSLRACDAVRAMIGAFGIQLPIEQHQLIDSAAWAGLTALERQEIMEAFYAENEECIESQSGINFPQMKSVTFQMQNREGILGNRREMFRVQP